MLRTAFTGFILLLLLFGCSSKSTVVLLPDLDGTVGAVEVKTEGGSRILTEPNQATQVKDVKSTPSKPEILSDAEIAETFRDVLAIAPVPPQNFILYFEFDSLALTRESETLLAEIIEALNQRNPEETEVIVSGHADTAGDKSYNIKLSLKRAQQVQDRLVSLGAGGYAIQVASHGEGNPLVKTADNVSEPQNRRVEVTVK